MLIDKLTIGLVFGGNSSEHEVSIKSAKTIFNALIHPYNKNRFLVNPFYIDKSGFWRDCEYSKSILLEEETTLLSNNYTEVITDPNNNDDFQHRIINIGTKSQIVDHRIFLKSINSMLNPITFSKEDDDMLSDHFNLENFIDNNNQQENDDLILGINVCLN